MEGDQVHQSDDDHSDHQHLFNPKSSSLTCTIFFKSSQDQGTSDDDHHDQQKIKDQQLLPYQSNMNKNSDNIVKHSREEEDRKKPTKWMSSKMRFMRKMMINPHNIIPNRRRRSKTVEFGDQQTNQDSTVIRVCSDCHTTKTPLWRSGPQGPKSLCNACGIRRRKARRVIAAAGTEGLDNGMIPADSTGHEVEKQKRSNVDETMPFKKRCKIITSQETTDKKKKKKKKHCFDLSKSSALHSVLPQDERDAAILLMALSYGLICS
ncbi:hypothetical protein J5N97_012959 [Dioscorea zingiberensis]|uniref:GATA-type domain-containing protein n=1 Tax=Dioscorea zingiberensis TaxID=325984 RepID=A0A9D5CSH1_9LILI|nr:hypothetical protein J5N97_012959 [Dioscorea zingiberensis]